MDKNKIFAKRFCHRKNERRFCCLYTEFLIAINFLIYISCSNKTENAYYDNGVLRYEKTVIDKKGKLYDIKSYYSNGKIKREGLMFVIGEHEGLPHGFCKEYYSDGALRWEGLYDSGHIVLSYDTTKYINRDVVEIVMPTDSVVIGKTYEIRANAPHIHSNFYKITYINYVPLNNNENDDKDLFPFIISINKDYGGYFPIMIAMYDENGAIIYGDGKNIAIFKLPIKKDDKRNKLNTENDKLYYFKQEQGDFRMIENDSSYYWITNTDTISVERTTAEELHKND